jgi:Fe-S cluster biogenesis protein NfuA
MSATLTVSPPMVQSTSPDGGFRGIHMAEVDKQLILQSVGPVQAILDAHDGIVNVVDTTDGIIMISLEGGCTGCSSTPMTAMQIYYSLMKLDEVNDVIFVNGELPAYMRAFIDDKLGVLRTEE